MAIDRGRDSGVAVEPGLLRVYGEVDAILAEELLAEVIAQLAAGVPAGSLCIDLADVLILSARGVHALEQALEAAREAGVRLDLSARPECAAHLVLHRIGMGPSLG